MKRTAILAGLALALLPGTAWAPARCTVSGTTVAFGVFNPFGSTLTSTGTITVACHGGPPPATYTIALSTGNSGSFSSRNLSSGTDALNYNMYTSSSYTSIWGDGTGGSVTVTGSDESKTKTYTVYAQLPAPQGVTPAAYSDTITVTVTY